MQSAIGSILDRRLRFFYSNQSTYTEMITIQQYKFIVFMCVNCELFDDLNSLMLVSNVCMKMQISNMALHRLSFLPGCPNVWQLE